jgi:hypothetical protein
VPWKLSIGDYYRTDVTEHQAQGDIYEAVKFVHSTEIEEDWESSGVRKMAVHPVEGVWAGLLISHTCAFVAQPPGTPGYSHPFRVVAPIWSVGLLAEQLTDKEIDNLRTSDPYLGYMYLPADGEVLAEESAALLFRPALVAESALDMEGRRGRLAEGSMRVLQMKVTETFTGKRIKRDQFEPDMSDSWNDYPIPEA